MENRLRFFKKDGIWYADVENHTLEENEMVMGADMMCEMLSNNGDELYLTFTDEKIDDVSITFKRSGHGYDGAYYTVERSEFPFINEGYEIWLCNVTHDVLGEHPEYLYIKK